MKRRQWRVSALLHPTNDFHWLSTSSALWLTRLEELLDLRRLNATDWSQVSTLKSLFLLRALRPKFRMHFSCPTIASAPDVIVHCLLLQNTTSSVWNQLILKTRIQRVLPSLRLKTRAHPVLEKLCVSQHQTMGKIKKALSRVNSI